VKRLNVNLLTGLIFAIILLGVISAATVFVNARTYRELALDFQDQYMTQLLAAESTYILAEEAAAALRLGSGIQDGDSFREAIAAADSETISAVLDEQFQLAVAASSPVSLVSLAVFDADFGLLGTSVPQGKRSGEGACFGLVTAAGAREGPQRLKPLHELCLFDGLPSLASLLPVGGDSPAGYLQIVTDPVPRLMKIGSRLKMPVQISQVAGPVLFTTPRWLDNSRDYDVKSDYVLSTSAGRPVIRVTAQRDADAMLVKIDKTNKRLLLIVVLIILATVALALLMVRYSVLKPLRDLSYQLRGSRNRSRPGTPDGPDTNAPVSFHALGELYETLHDMAIRDPLTGTYNRALLEDRLKQVIAEHRRTPGKAAILLIDLVRFKYVNDLLGHHTGDLLLKQVVERVGQVLRESDTLARLGGDEFVIILPDTDAEQASQVAEKITQSMEPEFEVEDHKLSSAVSIGIALMPAHGDDVETLLRNADYAMYSIKNRKQGYAIYDPTATDEISIDRMTLDGVLNEDMEQNDLFLVYQPVMEFGTGRVSYLEALVRWRRPDGRILMPEAFIRIAERSGLIRQLSEWVIDTACHELAELQHDNPALRAGINLSMHNLHDLNLMEQIRNSLARHRLKPESLLLEITETGVMLDPGQVIDTLYQLAAMGLKLSIDDFGTGHSSLVYLKRLPVHTLKVDKSFVVDMDTDEENAAIVRATIDLAHSLGLTVTAEGVETGLVHDQLQAMGCDYYQGYYVGRPKSLDGISRWLDGNRITRSLTRGQAE
jgi:diguanylate cyclase (GGDEF)-like protein